MCDHPKNMRVPKRMSAELKSLEGDRAVQVHGDAKNKKNVVVKEWLPLRPGSAKVINQPIQCTGLGGIPFLPQGQGLRCNLLPRPCYAFHLAL